MSVAPTVSALQWNSILYQSSQSHVYDIGPSGKYTFESSNGTSSTARIQGFLNIKKADVFVFESMEFGDFKQNKGKYIVLSLLLEDGIPDRLDRLFMMSDLVT